MFTQQEADRAEESQPEMAGRGAETSDVDITAVRATPISKK